MKKDIVILISKEIFKFNIQIKNKFLLKSFNLVFIIKRNQKRNKLNEGELGNMYRIVYFLFLFSHLFLAPIILINLFL